MWIGPLVRAAIAPLLLLTFGCGDAEERARDGGARDGPSLDAATEPAEVDDGAPAEPQDDAGCSGGECTPASASVQLEDGVVGSACEDDAACGAGSCLTRERITGTPFPGGYCTGRCREDAACGDRGYCSPGFRGALGSCLLRCETDADCAREGYRCRMAGGIGRCMPGPRPLPEGIVGDACESDAECGDAPMACVAKLAGIDAPGGYCSQSCSMDDDCGPDGACVSGLGTAPLSIGTCFARCTPPEGCREGYTCNALSAVEGDQRGLCVPTRRETAQ